MVLDYLHWLLTAGRAVGHALRRAFTAPTSFRSRPPSFVGNEDAGGMRRVPSARSGRSTSARIRLSPQRDRGSREATGHVLLAWSNSLPDSSLRCRVVISLPFVRRSRPLRIRLARLDERETRGEGARPAARRGLRRLLGGDRPGGARARSRRAGRRDAVVPRRPAVLGAGYPLQARFRRHAALYVRGAATDIYPPISRRANTSEGRCIRSSSRRPISSSHRRASGRRQDRLYRDVRRGFR